MYIDLHYIDLPYITLPYLKLTFPREFPLRTRTLFRVGTVGNDVMRAHFPPYGMCMVWYGMMRSERRRWTGTTVGVSVGVSVSAAVVGVFV